MTRRFLGPLLAYALCAVVGCGIAILLVIAHDVDNGESQ